MHAPDPTTPPLGSRPARTARRLLVAVLGALLAVALAAGAGAARDASPPRIVAATMLDRDVDGRADAVRLTFSERVRHAADRDGRYPISVAGYRVASVGAARAATIVVSLVEHDPGDADARPAVGYRPTRRGRVLDRAGNQAAAQTFRRTAPHGVRPGSAPSPTPAPAPSPASPPPVPTAADRDGDGALDGDDCGPDDPTVRPGVPDLPDLDFVDANCDGIDGDAAAAIYVSPRGKDAQPGTREAPKREISSAIAAAAPGQPVLVAAGTYGEVDLKTGVSVYGGYDPVTWRRGAGTTLAQSVNQAVWAEERRTSRSSCSR
ncbi:MAG: DUF1565 domain-containing protein [Thermoleophilia bacterium]